ncbi:MAG: HAD family phosphatase [Nitrospirae bacterium]|nr:HAD family phosphatase [Nitrospirota bacterium]
MIRVVLFDFGGVIAEEGFYQGLRAIAEDSGLAPDSFFRTAEELIHRTGYVTGRATEAEYWAAVRRESGIGRTDAYMREQIISRFVLRPGMLAHADRLRAAGRNVSILSDQTDWLAEIDRRTPFSDRFDRVYNSYHLHKSKRDATVFTDVCHDMAVDAGDVLFVDDNIRNVTRAAGAGLLTIHFMDMGQFPSALKNFGL